MTRALALVAAVPLLALGCGGDGGNGGPPGAVDPRAYARDVCLAFGYWSDAISQGGTNLKLFVEDDTPLWERAEILEEYFRDIAGETRDMVRKLSEAGVPDVEGGEKAAADMVRAGGEFRDSLARARRRAADLPTDNRRAFRLGIERYSKEARRSVDAVPDPTENLPEELQDAFDAEPACQG